ncbi:alpha-galactosidase [Psychromonas ossibalaenae]|uniref:alpha-galactosidase n=1 Tax=Psychromonas ossibalaenae TaxID=444922 RepID=UPI000381A692|nr:alpha-galactosidase [Psychromonas ossibalaenae]
MPSISFDTNNLIFSLQGYNVSSFIGIDTDGGLRHYYTGRKVETFTNPSYVMTHNPRVFAACPDENDPAFSESDVPMVYPGWGRGDLRYPALHIRHHDGNTISSLKYAAHRIESGKPELSGLPATYCEKSDECTTLTITLRDNVNKIEVDLLFTVFSNVSAIARSTLVRNTSEHSIEILNAQSMAIDFLDSDFELLSLRGAWAREFEMQSRQLQQGVTSVHSNSGNSGHFFNPFIALKRPDSNEFQGDVYGFSLVYSGNFLAHTEVSAYDQTRVMMGINPHNFRWQLSPGESFQTPEAVMVYSSDGMNGMSQNFHHLYRTRLARGKWKSTPRPSQANNWEATYFNFNEEKIINFAEHCKRHGVGRMTMDDGWFGCRNDDTSSLGDWVVDENKFPKGLKSLADSVRDKGVEFGIWVEPEMFNKDSNLYRSHPDWMLHTAGHPASHGRNQYILDLGREEVTEYLYNCLEQVFAATKTTFVKWDMNRHMTEVGSAVLNSDQQQEAAHRYILGLYKLLERLFKRFPEIVWENCASGGGRLDPGMLYYMPETWTSDNTDAADRLHIQYGASLVYPISSIVNQVSPAPNHQVGRSTPFAFRNAVALFGSMGYICDITSLSDEERQIAKHYLDIWGKYNSLIFNGQFWRLSPPTNTRFVSWAVIDDAGENGLLAIFKQRARAAAAYEYIKLCGLKNNSLYRVKMLSEPSVRYRMADGKKIPWPYADHDAIYSGAELMNLGFALPPEFVHDGDYKEFIYSVTLVN